MSRDLITVMPQEQLKLFFRRFGTLALANCLWIAFASPVQAQVFDQVITNAVGSAPCDVRIQATGNLQARICGQQGNPGASSGSTTTLSKEIVPVEERKVQRLMGPVNVFISGEYERFDKDETTFEPGHKTNTGRALIGADYSFGDWLVLGGAFQYANDQGKFDSESPFTVDFAPGVTQTFTVPRGRFDTDSYGALFYANFLPMPQSFIHTSFGYTRKNYFISRGVSVRGDAFSTATGSAAGDTNGNEFKVGANGGYNFNFESITFGPRLGLNYRRTEIDGFRERGRLKMGSRLSTPSPGTGLELIYNSQHENSLTSVLGMYGSVAISTGFGVLVPQTTLEYVHEFLDPQRKITFSFVDDLNRTRFRFENDPPDRNYFNLGAGVVLQLARGIAPFINYRALVGYKDQRSHTVTGGLRIEF